MKSTPRVLSSSSRLGNPELIVKPRESGGEVKPDGRELKEQARLANLSAPSPRFLDLGGPLKTLNSLH